MYAEFGCGNSDHKRGAKARRTLESMLASVGDGSGARRRGQSLRRRSGRLFRQVTERLVITKMTGRRGASFEVWGLVPQPMFASNDCVACCAVGSRSLRRFGGCGVVRCSDVESTDPTLIHPGRLVCLALRKKVRDGDFGCRTGRWLARVTDEELAHCSSVKV
jgi:hypothetical protein